MATVDFCCDFISPYAYLAWTQIHALAARHGRTVRPVPVLLAALLNQSGALGPAEIPPKRAYMVKDTLRLAAAFGVAFEPPPTHPFNPLHALRVAGLDRDDATQRRIVDALFHAAWGGGGGLETAPAIADALDRAGLPGAALVAEAAEPAAKLRLRASTDAAIAAGVFGVPTAIADGELFWGCDSLPHVERFLAGDDPLDADAVASFTARVPSATRT